MSRSSVDRMDMFWFEVGFLFSEFPWLQNDVKAMEKCHNFFHITFYDGTRVGGRREQTGAGVINDLKKLVDQEMGRVFITNWLQENQTIWICFHLK